MLFCGIDIETTGLELDSEITEISWVFMKYPLFKEPALINQNFCKIKGDMPPEIEKLTGITKAHLDKHGQDIKNVLWLLEQSLVLHKPSYIVAHNGENFDKPMLLHWANKLSIPRMSIEDTHWLDTGADIPSETFGTSKLAYMAAECGFINPFPHSAVFDVMTMFRVLSKCDVEAVVARSKEPWVVIRAIVGFDDRELAKKRKFRWQECGGETFPKSWVKRVKASEVKAEQEAATFKVVVIE